MLNVSDLQEDEELIYDVSGDQSNFTHGNSITTLLKNESSQLQKFH